MKPNMKIAIEALAHEGNPVGAGYYALSLLQELEKHGANFDFYLYDHLYRDFNDRLEKLWLPKGENFRAKFYKVPRPIIQFLEERIGLHIQERWLRTAKVDIFHGIHNLLPPISNKIKKVVTVHDVGHLDHPDWYWDVWYRRFDATISEADKIITGSHFTANEITSRYNVSKDKIKVIKYRLNPNFRVIDDASHLQKIKEKYNLPEKLFCFIGGLRPIKNIPRILEAFSLFLKEGNEDWNLVLIGKEMYRMDEISRSLKELGIKNNVIFTGYVGEEDLVSLLNLSSLFIFTTLYEGFGYPPLEAMACGVPVIASNVASLPEVCGDAALLVDPYSVIDIADGMLKLAMSKDLREDLTKKGFNNIKSYDCESFISEHLSVYHEISDN